MSSPNVIQCGSGAVWTRNHRRRIAHHQRFNHRLPEVIVFDIETELHPFPRIPIDPPPVSPLNHLEHLNVREECLHHGGVAGDQVFIIPLDRHAPAAAASH